MNREDQGQNIQPTNARVEFTVMTNLDSTLKLIFFFQGSINPQFHRSNPPLFFFVPEGSESQPPKFEGRIYP